QAEALSRVGSMKFVPGRLTELVTPPNPANLELSHGYGSLDNLALDNCPPKCQADSDTYLMSQAPLASYEAVVDSTSGDIGPTLRVERVVGGTTTVIQSSVPIGVGFSRSLRWMNTTN